MVHEDEPAFAKLLETSLEQKRVWLKKTGRPVSKFDDRRIQRMLAEPRTTADQSNGSIAFSLNLDGVPIATEIGFRRMGHYYSYLGSFDWAKRDYSPGKLLLEDTIAWAIDNNIETYDLLGNPSPYKETLADHRIPLAAYAHGKTLIGKAYARFWRPRIRPSVKHTISSLPVSLRQTLFGAAGRFLTK